MAQGRIEISIDEYNRIKKEATDAWNEIVTLKQRVELLEQEKQDSIRAVNEYYAASPFERIFGWSKLNKKVENLIKTKLL